jgi:6-phosphogluconolactonase
MTADERANEAATRRGFLKIAGMSAAGLAMSGAADALPPVAARELLVYVGTYTSGGSEGIYLYRLDLKTGALIHAGTTRGVVEPSYLTLDRRGRFLYAVNEVEEYEGARSGAVSAFAIDRRTGALRFINRRASKGGAPCYVTTDKPGRFILVANYVGGNVAVLPIEKDGSLGETTDVKQDSGSGPNRERQEGPHAHCIVLDGAGRFAYACDLGTDRVMAYRFDAHAGRLVPNAAQPFVELKPGAGPRHMIFHPGGRFAYVMNELDSTVTVFARDGAKGTLRASETLSTLPAGFAGANTGADLHATHDGRFLFCSNRGHDSIASFRVDASGLRSLGHTHTGGKTPRNFAIDPTGRFLLVANQKSDNVVTFRLDPATGSLEPTGQTASIPAPVCLKFTARFL